MKRSNSLALIFTILCAVNLELLECKTEDRLSFINGLTSSTQISRYGVSEKIPKGNILKRQIRVPMIEIPIFHEFELPPEIEEEPELAGPPPRPHSEDPEVQKLQEAVSASNAILNYMQTRGPELRQLLENSPPSKSERVPSRSVSPLPEKPSKSFSAGPASRRVPPLSAEPSPSLSDGAPPRVSEPLSEEPSSSLSAGAPPKTSEDKTNSFRPYLDYQFLDGSDYPQYSVVDHYYYQDRGISMEAEVEADVIKTCENITFCLPNTAPLCLINGTVYCVTSLVSTVACNPNYGEMKCVNSSIAMPCDVKSTSCNDKSLNTTAVYIPCLATIDVLRVFASDEPTVVQILKRSVKNKQNYYYNMNVNNFVNNADLSEYIGNKYCVTVIAPKKKKTEVPSYMSNKEFVQYLNTNKALAEQAKERWSDISNNILAHVL